MNNNANALFFTHKVCVEAPQTLRSHRRIRLREILLACLSAKRFDMEVEMDTEKVIKEGVDVPEENSSAPEDLTADTPAPKAPDSGAEDPSATEEPSGTEAPEEEPAAEEPAEEEPAEEPAAEEPAEETTEEPPAEVKVKKTFLRPCGSWTDIIPIAAMLSVILTILGSALSWILDGTVIPAGSIGLGLLGDWDSVEFLLQYFEFYGIWLMFMLVILLFKDNWPMWKAFLYNGHGNNLKAIPAGILLGFGMNGFCVLMSAVMGDIKLSFNGFAPVPFFVFLLCVLIQSGAEEIVDRCYLYQKLRRRYRWPVIAVLVNALVFMSLHMGNPGVTKLGLLQVFLIGVLFSLIVYYWDSLWTVIWAHTAWNFSQSIVFGLPNSGIVSKYSVVRLEAASARDGIFYNTSFGVEGSMGANAIIAGAIVIVLIYGLVTKRGEKADHWEELEKRDAGRSHIWEAVVLTAIMAAIIGFFALANLWLNNHADEVQQFLQEVQEQQAVTQEQEGQQPGQEALPGQNGQETVPGQSGQPAQETAPGQSGQETAPGQSAQPGQETAPDQSQQPGQETAPGQNGQPAQETAPGQSVQPGQETAADQNQQPGQEGGEVQNTQP